MQQAPAVHAPAQQQQNGFAGMPGGYEMGRFGGPGFQRPMGFGGVNGGMVAQPMQGKPQVQDAAPQIDEAAFEQAFAQVDQDMAEEAIRNLSPQDYSFRLMMLEQQEKKRKLMAAQAQIPLADVQPEQIIEGPSTMEEAQSRSIQRDIRGEQHALLEREVQSNALQQEQGRQSENILLGDDPVLIRIREQRPGKSHATSLHVPSKSRS